MGAGYEPALFSCVVVEDVGGAGLSNQPSEQVKRLVDRRDNWRCVRCGKPLGSTWMNRHHRRMRSHRWPGLHEASNLILLCGSGDSGCHGDVHGRATAEAYEKGWLVHAWQDHPEMVPVLTRQHGWVLLDDQGGWTPVQIPTDTEGVNHE